MRVTFPSIATVAPAMPKSVTASFSAAWLAGDERALAFLPDRYRRPDERRRAVEAASRRSIAPALFEAIAARNASLPKSAARERNLERLSQAGTVAVVTGQQAGLFLGPLFTVYKTASAIVTARALEEETGRPCVPVFWLQDEDHDLPEIDHCVVPTGGNPLRLQLSLPDAASSRLPVSEVLVGDSVAEALAALQAELGRHPHAEEHLSLLARAYRPEATVPGAFVEVLSELFADEGLIVVDPRDPDTAVHAAELHRRALREAPSLSEALRARVDALKAAGFKEQVHVRPGSPLSFVAPEGERGPRYRLDPGATEGEWKVVGGDGSLTSAELERWLDEEPRRFTTSALLRPLLQDSWLPTAAYVGGPGELAYFAQLGPLYEAFELPMPLAVPRARFRVLDDRTRGLLERLGLEPDEVSRPREELLTRLATEGQGDFETPESVEATLLASIAPALAAFGERAAALDPSLVKAATRTDALVREAVGKLTARYGRVLARRDEVGVERVDRLRALLLPEGAPQERVYSLPYFACRFGQRDFVRLVIEATEPFSGALKDLKL